MTRSATWSQAAESSIKPPSTDCSASIECGGSRKPSPASNERLLTRLATCKACAMRLCRPLLVGDDSDRQGHINVCVQMQLHLVLAERSDRPGRHAHFAAADRLPVLSR